MQDADKSRICETHCVSPMFVGFRVKPNLRTEVHSLGSLSGQITWNQQPHHFHAALAM